MDFLKRIEEASQQVKTSREHMYNYNNGIANIYSFTPSLPKIDINRINKPVLICFEGIDGSGKDTQINLYKQYLEKTNKSVYIFNSLGNTEISKIVRARLEEGITPPITMVTLFLAELALVNEQLTKLIESKEYDYILINRWLYSTYAYGYKGDKNNFIGAGIQYLSREYIMPDILIIFNLPCNVIIERLAKRGEKVNQEKFITTYNIVNDRYSKFIDYASKISNTKVLEIKESNAKSNPTLDKIPGWATHCDIIYHLHGERALAKVKDILSTYVVN